MKPFMKLLFSNIHSYIHMDVSYLRNIELILILTGRYLKKLTLKALS